LQTLHVTGKCHWILAIKGKLKEVDIYDSLISNNNNNYPKEIIKVIAKIVGCSKSTLKINIKLCQQQTNDIDCAVFTIANAVEQLLCGNIESASYEKEKLESIY